MGKSLLFSLLFISFSLSKCNQSENKSGTIEKEQTDSIVRHNAPNQDKIDSIKLIKTKKKQKKKNDNS